MCLDPGFIAWFGFNLVYDFVPESPFAVYVPPNLISFSKCANMNNLDRVFRVRAFVER